MANPVLTSSPAGAQRALARRARLDETAVHALSRISGLELAQYRPDHVEECLRRAMEREGSAGVHALVELMRSDGRARSRFRRSLAVSVTGQFPDPAQLTELEPWLGQLPLRPRGGVSVWSAGCANGAELFTAGILLYRAGLLPGARLLGSDVLEENLDLARAGGPDPELVPQTVRTLARWEVRDLLRDGATGGLWSLVICRNVAIYLTGQAKDALQTELAGAVAPGGVLLLGRGETIADPARLGLEPVAPHLFRSVR